MGVFHKKICFFLLPIFFVLFVFLVSSSKRGNLPHLQVQVPMNIISTVSLNYLPYIHSIKTSIQVLMWQSLNKNTLQSPQVLLAWERDPIWLSPCHWLFSAHLVFFLPFSWNKTAVQMWLLKTCRTNRQLKWRRSFGRRRPWDKAAEPWQFSAVDLHMSTWAWQPGKTYLPLKWHSPCFGKKSSNHPFSGATVSLKEGHPQWPLVLKFDVWWFISTINSRNSKKQKSHSYKEDGFYWWSVQNF